MPEAVRPLRVAVVGLGTIGHAVAEAVRNDAAMALAGLVEVNADTLRDTAAAFGIVGADGVVIGDDPEALDADVAVVCTSPLFDRIAPTIRRMFKRKIPVVAACAEATWPWLRHPHLADVIAGEARAAGVAVVGGDVYPGFGGWPHLVPTQSGVRRVAVRRTAEITNERESVRRRCGLGKTVTQFTALARQNLVGQPGLGESVVVIAQSLGRHPMRGQIATTVLPLPAETAIDTPYGRIEAGHVAGVRQRAAYQDDDLDIEIELTLALPPTDASTTWTVDADESTSRTTNDDGRLADAVVSLLDAARSVGRLPPGLRTVLDLRTV